MGRPRTPAAGHEWVVPRLLDAEECDRAARALDLPPQQARIVSLILQGKRDKQIAAAMGLQRPTVRTHLARIFSRLGVADRMELVLRVFADHLKSNR